ncbi:MAG: GGDEF domain-containing protein [Sandaracinaceae bacterium]
MDDDRTTIEIETEPLMASLPRDRLLLTMLAGPSPGALHEVSGELVLGRGQGLVPRIDDRGMSRRHARLFKVGPHYYLEDLGSTNGTRVNGRPLTRRQRLGDGDRIQLGENTVLRVSLQDAQEAEAARRLYESAVLDPLTQVYNRGHFDERLQGEHAFAERHREALSVLLLDLDRFKRVNDTWGHAAGDAVLQATATAVKGALRTEDVFARYGGEEFVILARGTDRTAAARMAERVRRVVEALAVPWAGGELRVTASIGVATFVPGGPFRSAEALVQAADRATYQAKGRGRNRVCEAPAAASSRPPHLTSR